jgi:hypothetical protein
MLALFQDAIAWNNESCQMLSLLFSEVLRVSPQGLLSHLPQMSIIPHVSPGRGGQLTNVGNLMGCSESLSFNSLKNQSTLLVSRAKVWW